MTPTPKEIATADQFIAHTRTRLTHIIGAMKEFLDDNKQHIEYDLTGMACELGDLCDNNTIFRDNLISAYVLAIYDLARQQ